MSAQDDDKTAIDRADGNTFECLFNSFFNEFTTAHGDADSEHAPKERCRKGMLHARHVREIAFALVPKGRWVKALISTGPARKNFPVDACAAPLHRPAIGRT